MNLTLSESQLSQTVVKIEVVQCPLGSSLQYSRINQDGNTFINKFKEWFSEGFLNHYAIILNTTENEQFILHYLQEGFASSIITNQQRQEKCYQMIETYNSPQFNKLFTVQEISDIKQLYKQYQQQYDLLKNSCIHYVNHVKEYINRFLLDINAHATQKIELQGLIAMAKILITNTYSTIVGIVQLKKSLKNIMQQPKELLKNPSLYYNILYEAIRCAKHQTKMQIFGTSVLIAIIFLLTEIPLINLALTIPAIILELYFIWVQIDEGFWEKCIKSLHRIVYVYFKTIKNSDALRCLFDLCSDLIAKFRIVKIQTKEIVIIGGCTITGIIGGTLILSKIIAIPAIFKTFCASQCILTLMKSCTLVITGALSGGEPACISAGAYLFQTGSASTLVASSTTVTTFSAKAGGILVAAASNPIVICAAIGALVGIGICIWLWRK